MIKFHVIYKKEDFIYHKPKDVTLKKIVEFTFKDYLKKQADYERVTNNLIVHELSPESIDKSIVLLLNKISIMNINVPYEQLDWTIDQIIFYYDSNIILIDNEKSSPNFTNIKNMKNMKNLNNSPPTELNDISNIRLTQSIFDPNDRLERSYGEGIYSIKQDIRELYDKIKQKTLYEIENKSKILLDSQKLESLKNKDETVIPKSLKENPKKKIKSIVIVKNFENRGLIYEEVDHFLYTIGMKNTYISDNDNDRVSFTFKDPDTAYSLYSFLNNIKLEKEKYKKIVVKLRLLDYNFFDQDDQKLIVHSEKPKTKFDIDKREFKSKHEFDLFMNNILKSNSKSKINHEDVIKNPRKLGSLRSSKVIKNENDCLYPKKDKFDSQLGFETFNIHNCVEDEKKKTIANSKLIFIDDQNKIQEKHNINYIKKNVKFDYSLIEEDFKLNSHNNINNSIAKLIKNTAEDLKKIKSKNNLWVAIKEQDLNIRQKKKVNYDSNFIRNENIYLSQDEAFNIEKKKDQRNWIHKKNFSCVGKTPLENKSIISKNLVWSVIDNHPSGNILNYKYRDLDKSKWVSKCSFKNY